MKERSRGRSRLEALSSSMVLRPRLGAALSIAHGEVIGKRARLVVVGIEVEPCDDGAALTKALAPFRGKGRFPVAGRSPEQDQAARSGIVEEPSSAGLWTANLRTVGGTVLVRAIRASSTKTESSRMLR